MHCTICYFAKLIQYMALSEYNMYATFMHSTICETAQPSVNSMILLSTKHSFCILNQRCMVCFLLLIALPSSISFLWSYDDNHIFEQFFWMSHEVKSHLFSMRASLKRLNASSHYWVLAYDDCFVVLLAALPFLLILAMISSLIEDYIGLIQSTIPPRFRLHFLKP